MLSGYLNAIGVAADGFESWDSLQNVLAGNAEYKSIPLAKFLPSVLPANERRRSSALVRLSFRSLEQVLTQVGKLQCSTVFASSGGDYDIFNKLCSALAKDEKVISPTQFHNSVHNAPAGYWGIATENTEASTTISAYDYSFVMGFLESLLQLSGGAEHVLYSCYDMQPPPPLNTYRPVVADYSVALLLSQEPMDSVVAKFELELGEQQKNSLDIHLEEPLATLAQGNAAARSLYLLDAVVRKRDVVTLECDFARTLTVRISYDC